MATELMPASSVLLCQSATVFPICFEGTFDVGRLCFTIILSIWPWNFQVAGVENVFSFSCWVLNPCPGCCTIEWQSFKSVTCFFWPGHNFLDAIVAQAFSL